MRRALLALALLSLGCQHRGAGASQDSLEPRPQTTVKVENQNFLDMDVYILRESQRIRLGMVGGHSTQVFPIPDDIVRSSPQVRFELHPIGGRANPRSESITVMPGDQVVLTIPPVL